MAKLDPTDVLKNGVITSDFAAHQNRTPPSHGIDIDDPGLAEESKLQFTHQLLGRYHI